MEPPGSILKSGVTRRNLVVRSLLVGVLFLMLRFVYVVTVHGESCVYSDFCFFSSSERVEIYGKGVTTSGSKVFVRGEDASAAVNSKWSTWEWRQVVGFYSGVFQSLIMEGNLSPGSKSLCVGTDVGHEVLALKEIGVHDAIGIGKRKSLPLVVSGDLFRQPFENDTFDFVFVGVNVIEGSKLQADLAMEIARILKPGWFLIVHTSSGGDVYSLNSFTDLFPSCRFLRSREIYGIGGSSVIQEIVLQKKEEDVETEDVKILDSRLEEMDRTSLPFSGKKLQNKCSIPEHKLDLIKFAEPLIIEEPLKPWITLKKNVQNIKYLPSMADISFKRKYLYIDVGARSYGSSIGSWFRKQYPKQNRTFEIYAIEADHAFHAEYATKKGIKLIPFAAWTRNEMLSFEVSHNPDDHDSEGKGLGMGRIRSSSKSLVFGHVHNIQGFDFAEWLKKTVTMNDFVVMKMDVEGTEFDLIPRLFETGAICLIDELFLECHYNRWQRCCPGQRSPKYRNTYSKCLNLFSSLRNSGVLVHQWW